MKEEKVSDASLRAFLLGQIDDEERDRIESLFLTDSQERERILSAEQDLIEDYLEDSLTPADKQRFIALYTQTAEQRRYLRTTKSIKDWAIREPALAQTAGTKVSKWARLRAYWSLKPALVIPITVVAMIAIVAAVVWLNNRESTRRHVAIEQELAQLNTPSSLGEALPDMVSVTLSPGSVRAGEQQNEIRKSGAVRIVELRLPWVQKERYSSYQAEIGQVRSGESFTIPKLHGENDRAYAVRLRVPAHLLDRVQYQIQLRGINADGTAGLTEEYLFTVNE